MNQPKTKTVNRKIRPNTRKRGSRYRVKIRDPKKELFTTYDKLIVNIDHIHYGFIGTYVLEGDQIQKYNNIHFLANESHENVNIRWSKNLEFSTENT